MVNRDLARYAGFAHVMDRLILLRFSLSHVWNELQFFTARTNPLRIRIAASANDPGANMKQHVVAVVLTNYEWRKFGCRSIGVMDFGAWRQWLAEGLFSADTVCIERSAPIIALNSSVSLGDWFPPCHAI